MKTFQRYLSVRGRLAISILLFVNVQQFLHVLYMFLRVSIIRALEEMKYLIIMVNLQRHLREFTYNAFYRGNSLMDSYLVASNIMFID